MSSAVYSLEANIENSMDHDQDVPQGAVWSGSVCLPEMLPGVIFWKPTLKTVYTQIRLL